jgi:phosphoglucomutase
LRTLQPLVEIDMIQITPTTPFPSQRPGTSGLRKKTRIFMQPHYLENFVQSVFDAVSATTDADFKQETLVIGGDGRYFNRMAIQTIVRIASANGFGRILVGRAGLLSTPAMSAVIRRRGALGGLVLSASHNPGGVDADFGIKYNVRNGGPAPETVTEKIYSYASKITQYRTVQGADIDLDRLHTASLAGAEVTVFDPLADYTALMEQIFDFQALRTLFHSGFHMAFDAMHGVTGPYAHHILMERLDAPEGTVIRGAPLEDFGGLHPDPNQVHAADLVALMRRKDAPDLGAACDGDGDRNMILGREFYVSPGDSLAVIAEQARSCIPGYREGLKGVARSMPTSTAVDRVARSLDIPCFETPTGWKFFGNLMDAGLCTLCGEESFGTGSNHVREKDGLWAVLAWLSILATHRRDLPALVREHWRRFGRSYYQRHDFEGLDAESAAKMMRQMKERLPALAGVSLAGAAVTQADDFSYTDPVDGSVSSNQGIRILLANGSRAVFRLSGTGTEGATLRLYLEVYGQNGDLPTEQVLAPLLRDSSKLLELEEYTGRTRATVIT